MNNDQSEPAPLETIAQEIEGGFHFREPDVDIKVYKTDSGYEMRWEHIKTGKVTRNPVKAEDLKSAYRAFRNQIEEFWSGNGYNFPSRQINNPSDVKNIIEELFAPMKKYEQSIYDR